MNGQTTQSALDAYAAAKNRRDIDAIIDACAPGCFYETHGLGGRFEGEEALRAFYGALFEALPDYYGDFDGTAVDGDDAIAWGRWGGTTAASFMGIEVEPGRPIEIPVAFVCRFEDGKLKSDVGYFDLATLAEQAGIPLARLRGETEPESSAAAFVAGFDAGWADPGDLAWVRDLVGPDVQMIWPGQEEPIEGQDAYIAQLTAGLAVIPDLRMKAIDHAERGETLMIAWEASGTVGASKLTWRGTDRFRLVDGRAVHNEVMFDTAPLRAALEEAPPVAAV